MSERINGFELCLGLCLFTCLAIVSEGTGEVKKFRTQAEESEIRTDDKCYISNEVSFPIKGKKHFNQDEVLASIFLLFNTFVFLVAVLSHTYRRENRIDDYHGAPPVDSRSDTPTQNPLEEFAEDIYKEPEIKSYCEVEKEVCPLLTMLQNLKEDIYNQSADSLLNLTEKTNMFIASLSLPLDEISEKNLDIPRKLLTKAKSVHQYKEMELITTLQNQVEEARMKSEDILGSCIDQLRAEVFATEEIQCYFGVCNIQTKYSGLLKDLEKSCDTFLRKFEYEHDPRHLMKEYEDLLEGVQILNVPVYLEIVNGCEQRWPCETMVKALKKYVEEELVAIQHDRSRIDENIQELAFALESEMCSETEQCCGNHKTATDDLHRRYEYIKKEIRGSIQEEERVISKIKAIHAFGKEANIINQNVKERLADQESLSNWILRYMNLKHHMEKYIYLYDGLRNDMFKLRKDILNICLKNWNEKKKLVTDLQQKGLKKLEPIPDLPLDPTPKPNNTATKRFQRFRKEIEVLCSNIESEFEEWTRHRKFTILTIDKITGLLEELKTSKQKANIGWASAGLVGSGLTVAGIIAAPLSGGVSLALTSVGFATGLGSAFGGASNEYNNSKMMQNFCKRAERRIKVDGQITCSLFSKIEHLKEITARYKLVQNDYIDMLVEPGSLIPVDILNKLAEGVQSSFKSTCNTLPTFIKTMQEFLPEVEKLASKVTSKVVLTGAILVAVVIDISSIVGNLHAMKNNVLCERADILRDLSSVLSDELLRVSNVFQEFNKTNNVQYCEFIYFR